VTWAGLEPGEARMLAATRRDHRIPVGARIPSAPQLDRAMLSLRPRGAPPCDPWSRRTEEEGRRRKNSAHTSRLYLTLYTRAALSGPERALSAVHLSSIQGAPCLGSIRNAYEILPLLSGPPPPLESLAQPSYSSGTRLSVLQIPQKYYLNFAPQTESRLHLPWRHWWEAPCKRLLAPPNR
jgi:hypothetical protein